MRSGMDDFLLNAGAGSVGAIAGIVVGSPLDVIKTQLQSGKAPPGSSAFTLFRSALASPRAMFKGVGASAMSMAPNNFVMFGSYGSSMQVLKLNRHSESWSHIQRVGVAGSIGGFLQAFVVSPFELIKVQQQTVSVTPAVRPPSALAAVRSILQLHGAAGLWRGLSSVLVRDTPTFGVYFMVYEAAVDSTAKAMQSSGSNALLPNPNPNSANPIPNSSALQPVQPAIPNSILWTSQLVGGAAAGLACWSLALPMDVVKSVIQAAPLSQPSPSIRDAVTSVYRRAGLAGFWAGAAPCLLRAVPANAVTFFVFEYIKELAVRS